uniref:NADH-ubiquinone oxidoreductase chain 6 n=1 Tax=Leucophoroptera quadrimaculata TaxID=981277 RepID=A0A514LQK9_9HEMI|nr:NADH dehydrogenase subunit 6 [Leucophoroptera quadrimaculata]
MMIMLLITNMLFLFTNHPMSMGLTLILQTLIMSLISGLIMKTFWMSYILLITMLSGMLILFIYMSSMAPNEKFKNKMSIWMMSLMLTMVVILSLFLLNKMIIKNNYAGMEMSLNNLNEIYLLNKMFMKNNMYITIMMVVYLLLTMISSTHLINISEGPLRIKF